MNISRREKILLAATLYFIFIFAFYKLWYSPLNQQLAALNQENHKLINEKSSLQQLSQGKKQRQAEIKILRAENKRMEQKVPKDKEIVILLEELKIAADQSGVKLLSIEYKKGVTKQEQAAVGNNPDLQKAVSQTRTNLPASSDRKPLVQVPSSKTSEIQTIALNINIAGRYYQLRNFLLQVEKARRIISVQSCGLAAETKQTATDSPSASEVAIASQNSKDPPPPPPIAKGERNSAKDKDNTATNVSPPSNPAEKAIDRYDMNKMQMQLQINTFYSP